MQARKIGKSGEVNTEGEWGLLGTEVGSKPKMETLAEAAITPNR